MAIQFERRQCWEPHRRKNDQQQTIHKFWNPKGKSEEVQQYRIKAKTPQPSQTSSKKTVSFWETKKEPWSKSMVSLVQHEVDEKRGFTPSDVAKDPVKREFLTNLSKKIFSPTDKKMSRSFRVRRRSLLFP